MSENRKEKINKRNHEFTTIEPLHQQSLKRNYKLRERKKMLKLKNKFQSLYSPDCSAVQFFSYKRCRDNVNRASGFIFEPFGL